MRNPAAKGQIQELSVVASASSLKALSPCGLGITLNRSDSRQLILP